MARLSIPKELAKSGLLRTNLHAVRTVLARELGLQHFPISLDDKVKAQLANDGQTQYPYGWLVPSDMQLVRDQYNNSATRRIGMRVGTYGATRNTSRIGFIYPIKIGAEIHVACDDAEKSLHFGETFLLLSAMQNVLSFDVRFGDQFSLNTRIVVPDSVTIPFADTGDTTKPGAVEVTLQIVIETYAGFFHDISSVYDVDPIIGVATHGADGELEAFDDLPHTLSKAFNDERNP